MLCCQKVRPDLQLAFEMIAQSDPMVCATLMGYTVTIPITSGQFTLLQQLDRNLTGTAGYRVE
jgi:hypothetical protein